MILAKIDYSNTYISGTQTNGQVFISLIDAATGQPANGNNVVVSYHQNINGVTYDGQVTIAGQSAAIYTGLIGDADPSHPYFTRFQVTDVGAVPNPAPPVNACDLLINYITVDQPESAPGVHDAQLTINANSGYGPIQYSIDLGVTYQLSPTFTGLGSGLVQVKVIDGNSDGCTAQSAVTIPVLTSLLVADPSVTLPGGKVSRWNAAFNPVVFTYQRKDFEVSAVQLDTETGKAKVLVNGNVSAVQVNDMVYLNAGAYVGALKVLAVFGAGILLIDAPFTAAASGWININRIRPYYQVRTRITYTDPFTGLQNTITSVNRPDSKGLIKADISNFLQSLLQAKDDSDFTRINYRDSNLSASYQIAYAEYWDGKVASDDQLTYISINSPYYVVYAAKQLGERYGGNLAAYVPFSTMPDINLLARWITDFAEPAYSVGYPFDIGFIYSDDLTGLPLYCELTLLDINRNALPGGPQQSSLLNDDGSWLLNQEGSKFIIADQTTIATPIPAQLGLNRLRLNASLPPDVFYINIALKYDDEHTTHTITQTQTIRVDDAIDERSVYLRWIGLSGSWNYYRFVFNQEVSLDVQNAVIIKKFVSDWEHQDSIEEVISKSAGQKMKVVAEDLSISDIKGLQSIKYSPKVQMLINKNPVKWQTIVINTATYAEYETQNGRAPFSVTFDMPSVNIQTQ
jgi:hypothetical protein